MTFALTRQFARGLNLTRGARRRIRYLFRDLFLTPQAAPLTSPRICEPGPGTLTITDTENKLSIVDGNLVCAGGKAVPAWGDPLAITPAADRATGKTLFGRVSYVSGTNLMFGWGAGGFVDGGVWLQTNQAWARLDGGGAPVDLTTSLTPGVEYDIAIVQRTAGELILLKVASESAWRLAWVGISSANNQAEVFNYDTAFTLSSLRVLNLAPIDSRFATQDGLCTSVLVNPAAGATATMTPDAVVEYNFTFSAGASAFLMYRYLDENNYWGTGVLSTGAAVLIEKVGGVTITRVSVAGPVTVAAHRLIVVVQGATHSMYIDNVQQGSRYTDPSNYHINNTGLKVSSISGGVSRLAAYPRTISLPGV